MAIIRCVRGNLFNFGLIALVTVMTLAGVPSADAAADSTISISSVSGTFLPNPSDSGGFTAAPSTSVTFTQEFPVINFNPPAGAVKCSNQTGVNTQTHPFTDVVPQPDGSCKTMVAKGSTQQAGAGDMSSFQAVFTGSFLVTAPGRITFSLFSDDGWILSLGPNSGGAQPTYVSGPMLNFPKTGPFTGYTIVGSYNVVSSPNQNNLVVSFPAPGTFPFELDYSECCDGDLAFTVTANGAPIPQMAQLAIDVRGLTDAAQVQGQQHIEVAVTAGQAQQVELLVDGKSRGISHAPPFTIDWDASQETPGRHQVVLRGQDATGAVADKQLTLDVVAAAPLATAGPAPLTPVPVAAAPVAPVADSNGPLLAAGTILLLLLAGVGGYFLIRGSRDPAVAVAAPAEPAPAPAPVEERTEFIGRAAISDLTMVSNRRPQVLPKAKLLVKPDREVALSRNGETIIGRDAGNAAAVDDRQVSRHHARITCSDGDFWIEDLNSTNGTRVNGVKVDKQKLADNDQIGVGDTILTFSLERP